MPTRLVTSGFALLLLATTSTAVAAPIDDDPEASAVAVLSAFVDAFNARALDRAQALLAKNAILADDHREYVGAGAHEWLVRASNDGLRMHLLRLSRIDTDERGAPGHEAWWLSFTMELSWRIERDLGFAPHVTEASAILGGSVIHSLRVQAPRTTSEPPTNADVGRSEPPGEPVSPSPWQLGIMTTGVALLSVLGYRRRVRPRPCVAPASQRHLLNALHQAMLRRRVGRHNAPRG